MEGKLKQSYYNMYHIVSSQTNVASIILYEVPTTEGWKSSVRQNIDHGSDIYINLGFSRIIRILCGLVLW